MIKKFNIFITGSSRPELLKITVDSFKKFLYTEMDIKWILHEDFVIKKESEKTIKWANNSKIFNVIEQSPGIGLGLSISKMIKYFDTDYMLYIQDDWELERPIELDRIVWTMENHKKINNIVLPKMKIPKRINKIKQIPFDYNDLDLVLINGWYLNPGIWRTDIVKNKWVNIDKDKPEGSFINKFGDHNKRSDPKYCEDNLGVYFLGKIGGWRYVHHLGDTWRMASWRMENKRPGGNLKSEILNLLEKPPWISYKERFINRNINININSQKDRNYIKKISKKYNKDIIDHIMNGKEF